jgi:lipoprotein-releasing system permease protein
VVLAANSNYANVIVKGIAPATVGNVTDLVRNLKEKGALERLYPLTDRLFIDEEREGREQEMERRGKEGGEEHTRGAGDSTDPAPDDLNISDEDPIDFSGDGERSATQMRIDPAPRDLVVSPDRPIDWSGEEVDLPATVYDLEPSLDFEPPRVSPRVAALSGVLVGKELVKQLHLYVGQEVRMISPLSDPANPGAAPIPFTRNLRVAGTFFTGMYEYDLKFVYVELRALQQFLDLGDQAQGIEVRVSDPENPDNVVAAIRQAIGADYLVQDWQELNRNLFSALKLEKIAMFLVLAIIILVASFSIVGNLIMVVIEKAKEIALLKTLGASDSGVMQVFITQGFFIGTVGTIVGVAHGLVACWLGATYGLPLDPDVYYIDQLPIHVESSSVVAVVTAGIVISILATVYPAYVAMRMRPVDGLRNM